MAEIVLSAFFQVFFEKLGDEALKQIARSKGINSELKKVQRLLVQIQAVLNDASQKEISHEGVQEWLNSLQHLAYDIDDLLDELATEAIHRELDEESGAITSKVRKIIPTCCTSFSLSSRMHSKLDSITTKLQDLVDEKNNLSLIVKDESPKHKSRRLQTSLVEASTVVGRADDKEELLLKLYEPCDRNYSIVPIVGMGGVGKTTLARLLYNEQKVKDHFEQMAWVCVSDEFDIFNISKVIFQSIGGGNQEFKDLNLLQVALKETISNKRFLVVLDDVWSDIYTDWEILAGPFHGGAPGSKVIMTTRKMSLLTQLGYNEPYHLSVLSHESALSLFCQHSLGENNFDSHMILKPHGESIVRKCDGLPLALKALGTLLRTKIEEEDRKEVLNSEIWSLEKDGIIPALRLSYHDLSASLKQLFAYCSLFPKDYLFKKEKLVLLWMAEGFLHKETTNKSLERLGLEYFEELLSRSFFQRAPHHKSLFVMHDLMNDLATSVAGAFFSRLDIEKHRDFRKENLERYQYMSFVCEEYMAEERFKPFKGTKCLRTFLGVSVGVIESWKCFYLSNTVLHKILHELPLLRVLSLSNLTISEVPEFIGSLKHLRYLNLSRTNIKLLPENVCNLYNLQTLILFGCKNLTKLPNCFSKLKRLRHLDIRDTPYLKKMPLGIGELESLQTLSKIIIGGKNGLAISELQNLLNLRGKISIWGLGNVLNASDARKANISQKNFSELELDWDYGLFQKRFSGLYDDWVFEYYKSKVFQKETHDKEVLDELEPHSGSLERLEIVSYGGTEFPNWVGDPSFLRLTHVAIYSSEACISLPKLGQLPALKELLICGMSMVKVVGLELLGTGRAFPSLEVLSFGHMTGWEVWSANNSGVVGAAFPCLQQLHIEHCPNLVQVSLEALPSLRVVKLRRCGHVVLTSLVHVASSLIELKIHGITGLTDELWRGVTKNLEKVEEVTIRRCNEIRYLWESEAEASKVLVNLRLLEVDKCSNLVSLAEKEENCGSNLTSLRSLKIDSCRSMEHCSCPDNIELLDIERCDLLTSVSFRTGGGHKLKSLWIRDCKKLLEDELGGGGGENTRVLNRSMPMIESIDINDWPNLKLITKLNYFIHLTILRIINCPSMESFPEHELPNLRSLKRLTMENCTNMNASFPSGLWPPNLSSLEIGRLKKPMSEWGPQNFPPSIVQLGLWGGPCEDVSDFSRLSHLFPSSLTTLDINEFEKLESLSMGLNHLTSLQHLYIYKCPKTMDLPETLLPSLLSLRINECPNLKERSSRRDLYWPILSVIPCFEVDWELLRGRLGIA